MVHKQIVIKWYILLMKMALNIPENKAIIKYNGQDYENTSFLADIKYSEDGKEYSAINDKFLNLRTEDIENCRWKKME